MEYAYTIFREVIQVIYFISAPLVAFFAWRALKQIKIGADQVTATQEATKIQATRESFRLAAEQTRIFGEEIIPMFQQFHELKKDGKYPILSACSVTESWPHIESKTDNLPGLLEEVFTNDALVVRILNRMEGIAMFFACGVADADKAYWPLSSTFCEHVKTFLPYVVVANQRKKQFTYTIALYGAWGMRDHKERTEKELSEKKAQLSKVKVPELPTVGTNQPNKTTQPIPSPF